MLNTAPHEELSSLIADVYTVLERVQAGASIEEIELRVASAQATLDKLQEIVGAGPTGAFGDLSRHLHFIVHYHRKDQPENYASDLIGIREKDLPGVIKLVKAWGAPAYDPVLLEAVRVSWDAQHYASAVRDAFIVLEVRLRDLVDADPHVADSGVRLVTAVLGPTSPTRVALPTDTFMGKLTGPEADGAYALVKGAFQLFRNATAHRPIAYQRQQAEDVIRLVNLCLMLLPRPVGEDRPR
jgi:uncharacterized protein (TIGR02391 family)